MEVANRVQEIKDMNLLLTLLYAKLALVMAVGVYCFSIVLIEASRAERSDQLTLSDPTPAA
jgi:hypothetical protein